MNVVFDLGGVVFNWNPDSIIRRVFENRDTQALVKRKIFEHSDWVELDKGTLRRDRAIARGALRTGLSQEEIEMLLNEVPRSLTPIQGTFELIRSVRDAGNRMYVLSNMHHASIDHLQNEFSIWNMFDGIVVSCRIQKVKPEIEIFEHLLDEYQLATTETVFIDDTCENLTAASSLGMRTVRFLDPSQCRSDLIALNCL